MRNITTIFVFIVLAFSAHASLAESSLFGDKPSPGEIEALEKGWESATKAITAIGQLESFFNLQQMQQGDCEPALEIDAKAKAGDAAQQLMLGQLYAAGLCVAKDQTQAAHWFESASKQGNSEASRLLALAYQEGVGVEKDQTLAVTYMAKAAEGGDAPGMIALALYLLEGKGVPQNPARAVSWLEKAAATGSIEANARLGFLYLDGDKIPRDLNLARKWSVVAADRGAPFAQLSAGLAFVELGNLVEAHKWLNLAAASEYTQVATLAAKTRAEIEPQMAPDDLDRARAMASAWSPKTEDAPPPSLPAISLPDYPAVQALKSGKEQALAELRRVGVPLSKDAYFDAAKTDKIGVFILFTRAGASVNERWGLTAQMTPLYTAVDFGAEAVFEYLLQNGADPNLAAENGMTPLVRAIAHDRSSMVSALVSAGATANAPPATDKWLIGATPLAYALMTPNVRVELVKRLVAAGASVDEVYPQGFTPLMQAVSAPPEVFNYLLQVGADPNARDDFGDSVLMHLVRGEKRNLDNLRTLIRGGARFEDAPNKVSPLVFLAWKGDAQAVKILLEGGAPPDPHFQLTNDQIPMNWEAKERTIALAGGTPLMIATARGNAAVVRELVQAGADPAVTVRMGSKTVSATDLASEIGSPLLIQALQASPHRSKPIGETPKKQRTWKFWE